MTRVWMRKSDSQLLIYDPLGLFDVADFLWESEEHGLIDINPNDYIDLGPL